MAHRENGSGRQAPDDDKPVSSKKAPRVRVSLDEIELREAKSDRNDSVAISLTVVCRGCHEPHQARVDMLKPTFRCPGCGTCMVLKDDGTWRKTSRRDHPTAVPGFVDPDQTADLNWGTVPSSPLPETTTARRAFPVRLVGLSLAVMVSVGIVLGLLRSVAAPKISIPEDLDGRTKLVLAEVMGSERDLFVRVIDPATRPDSEQWLAHAQASLAKRFEAVTGQPTFDSETILANRAEGIAVTEGVIGLNADQSLTFLLYWKPDSDGSWILDGQRTLAEWKSGRH